MAVVAAVVAVASFVVEPKAWSAEQEKAAEVVDL